jgi:hypothetical protein
VADYPIGFDLASQVTHNLVNFDDDFGSIPFQSAADQLEDQSIATGASNNRARRFGHAHFVLPFHLPNQHHDAFPTKLVRYRER